MSLWRSQSTCVCVRGGGGSWQPSVAEGTGKHALTGGIRSIVMVVVPVWLLSLLWLPSLEVLKTMRLPHSYRILPIHCFLHGWDSKVAPLATARLTDIPGDITV